MTKGRLDGDKSPPWYKDALKRMKATGRPGVVLVAPVDESERERMAKALLGLLDSKDADVREVFGEAVFVCLVPDVADGTVRDSKEKGNRILLDAAGQRQAADAAPLEKLENAKEFVASFRELLHGGKGERLRATVEWLKKGLTEAERDGLEKAIDLLDGDGPEPANEMGLLRRNADRIAPWLVLARLDSWHQKGRERFRSILEALNAPVAAAPPRLPYGTELKVVTVDPCPACGMAQKDPQNARFLRFLTGAEK